MIELVLVEREPMTGRVLTVSGGTVIGREGCDVVLADPEVSRRHAIIHEIESAPAIEDLGSTNGTFVNGQRITSIARLRAGDKVQLGNTIFTVEAPWSKTRVADAQVETPDLN